MVLRIKKHKRKIIKTLIHLSFVYFCIFTSYRCLESIQSSLNFEEGRGTVSLSVLYSAYGLSCLSIGPIAVSVSKPKWTLVIGCVVHTLYVLANIWPFWPTLVTASIALGIVSSFVWITNGIYITNLALEYSRHSKHTYSTILSKFLGIFYFVYGFTGPVGSIISSLVLDGKGILYSDDTDKSTTILDYQLYTPPTNYSNLSVQESLDICGPNHCPYMETHSEVMQRPDDTIVYTLIGVFVAFDVIGIILCILLPNVPYPQDIPVRTKLFNIISIFRSVDLMLMIPMYCFLGMYAAVFYGSFTMVRVHNAVVILLFAMYLLVTGQEAKSKAWVLCSFQQLMGATVTNSPPTSEVSGSNPRP